MRSDHLERLYDPADHKDTRQYFVAVRAADLSNGDVISIHEIPQQGNVTLTVVGNPTPLRRDLMGMLVRTHWQHEDIEKVLVTLKVTVKSAFVRSERNEYIQLDLDRMIEIHGQGRVLR